MEWLIVAGSILFFVVIWCGVIALIAVVGGWQRLAMRYRAEGPPQGERFPRQFVRVNWCDYNGCVTIHVSKEGLRIAVMPLFAIAHPPLFLPWSELQAIGVDDHWWSRCVTVETPAGERLRLPTKVMAAAGQLRPESAKE